MEIKEINSNDPVSGQYLILENQLRTAKNGNPYLAMKIGDQSGDMAVKIWDATPELFQQLEAGKVIEIKDIQPKTFKDQIQLEWEGRNNKVFKVLSESEIDYSKFLPKSPGDLTAYLKFIREQIQAIQEPSLQKILGYFFDDQQFMTKFIMVPAALKRHHAYIGGLLEHTAGVTALCQSAARYYPYVNKDLVITGAILHDIGKIKTYKLDKGIEGTDEGKLVGHLILGVQMVEKAIDTVLQEENPIQVQQIRNCLIHLLVSHHGIMEWGSPVEPLTIEACILHHADNMDAQIQKFLALIRSQNSNQEWAPYDPGLGRSIFLGGLNSPNNQLEIPEGA